MMESNKKNYPLKQGGKEYILTTSLLGDTIKMVCKTKYGKSFPRIFTLDEFNNLAYWKYCTSPSQGAHADKFITKSGNTIICDSKSECMMLEYLEDNCLVLELGGQNICIPYK